MADKKVKVDMNIFSTINEKSMMKDVKIGSDKHHRNDENDGGGDGEMLSPEFGIRRFPETEQELDYVDEMLANEFNQLSMGEKEKVMFDIHGIAQKSDIDDPSNIEDILQQLETDIENIQQKDEYNLAKVKKKKEKQAETGYI